MSNRVTDRRTAETPSFTAGWKHSAGVRWALVVLFVLLFYFNLSPHLVPTTYDIKLNTISDRDIVSPVQKENEKATLQAQEEAANRVEPIYTIVALHNEELVAQIFTRMEQLNADDQVTVQNKVDIYRREIPQRYEEFIDSFVQINRDSGTYNAGLLEEMAKNAKEQIYDIPEETFYKLPQLSSEQIGEMRAVAVDVVRRLMNEQLREAETARTRVAELVNASTLSQRTTREIVQELARFAITPNKFYDKEATEEARVKAKENTAPVIVKEGDVVVKRGQLIDQETYDLLGKLGLLKDKISYWPQVGVLLVTALITAGVFAYMEYLGRTASGLAHYTNMQILMLLLILALGLLIMQVVGLVQDDPTWYAGYLAPAAMGAVLITLLLDVHLAIFSIFLFALMGSVIFNTNADVVFDFRYGLAIAAGSFAAVLSVHRASQRSMILKAGIMAGLFSAVSVLALEMFADEAGRTESLYAAGFAFAGGLLTAVLVIGLMPFFEITFGILSALKLVELSNPNHPLLRKLLTETPGTYHHSVMVGNLSEAAAESIGANGLLCRVGSFYHDIGKTKRPSYFIENQTNIPNPHDSIDPKLSKSIIIAHARDGVDMLKAHNLPKPIRDIAEQHHGTTFLKYFYHKALKQAEQQGVEPDFTEDDFRYPGPKAQSKEAAIVGIADSVEAAVRSLRSPTMEQIELMIHKIIKDRLDDNQFNECDLTMRELDRIAETLRETVFGIFHSRIEYPEDTKPKEKLG